MIRRTAGGGVCDEHPELGAMSDEEAWRHVETFHPDFAKMAGRLVEEIGKATFTAPRPVGNRRQQRRRPGNRGKRGKRRRR